MLLKENMGKIMDVELLDREKIAQACASTLDTDFFTALCEPVRVALIRTLIVKGRSDIQTLAEDFSQDRSVISRHLKVLQQAGIVTSEKISRHQYFQLDGRFILQRLSAMASVIEDIIPICCPQESISK